ncbi:MAG: serine hydrolase [Candidatus Levybacteria bacterium]|nr:serine hydrolase [Candidatus Levybacteria bacterium]
MMRYYDFNEPRRPVRRVKRKNVKVLGFMLLAFVLLPAVIGVYIFNREEFSPQKQTLAITIAPTPTTIPTPTSAQSIELDRIVKEELEGTKGKYSVVVKHLQTGEKYSYNEHQSYQAGSLYKLWVMAVAYNQLQNGTLKENDVLKSDVTAINEKFNIGTESAELKEGEVSFPVNQALQQMITISHNYAALLLAQKVKLSNVTIFLTDNQLTESKIGQPPRTTANDIAHFFEDLYGGKLANKDTSNKMIDLLKRQRLNNKLPKNLPEGTVIAHKTGELGPVTHDAGIVYTSKGEYIIVVLSESTNPAVAEERIANISKGVFEYFINK